MDNDKDLDILRTLAELDGRKGKLAKAAAQLPAAAAEREEALAGRREKIVRLRDDGEAMERERRQLEGTIEDRTQLLKKYRAQLDSVKTNREYQSLQREIALAREETTAAEDRLLEVLDRSDNLLARLAAEEAAFAREEAEVAAASGETQARLRDINVQLLEVKEKRGRLIPELSPQIRCEYQRIAEHYGGDAFTRIVDGVCQGCFVNIPAKTVSEIRGGHTLYRCESCGRFVLAAYDEPSD